MSKSEKRWFNLMNSLADFEASDGVLRHRELQESLLPEPSQIREHLQGAVKNYRTRHLLRARQEYLENTTKIAQIPTTAGAQVGKARQILQQLLEQLRQTPQLGLTLQYRDYKDLSDADVQSCIRLLEFLRIKNSEGQDG